MQVFHKRPENPKTKLLYLGGATWKIASMFDLKSDEDSFCDLLLADNIEVFSFDLPDTDHASVVNWVYQLVEEYKINYIMGYSYGCISAIECALTHQLDGIILLDPFSGVPTPSVEINNTFEYTVSEIEQLINDSTSINNNIKKLYLDSLSPNDKFTAPTYPKKLVMDRKFLNLIAWTNIGLIRCPVFTAFTSTARPQVKNYFSRFKQQTFTNSSHWILLEDGRFALAAEVSKFVEGKL
jgi:pimeloyl-ACP methyl ester carboxylesterase